MFILFSVFPITDCVTAEHSPPSFQFWLGQQHTKNLIYSVNASGTLIEKQHNQIYSTLM